MTTKELADFFADLIIYFNLKEFLRDNPPLRLAIIFALMIIMLFAARLLCAFLKKKLENSVLKSSSANASRKEGAMERMDVGLFEEVMRNTRRCLTILIIYGGVSVLSFPSAYEMAIHSVFTILCIFFFILFFNSFLPFNVDLCLRRRGATLSTSQARSLMPIIKGLVWALGLTFMLDNLGFSVSTIIAGLGIAGVAAGLAGQAILADFFSYIVILLDKPFVMGDFVELSNGKSGVVEDLGPKTTRLRSLDDDVVVCANSEMTRGILVNQGLIRSKPVILGIGVEYATPFPQIKRVPHLMREVVESIPNCKFERCVASSMGSANLNFQLIALINWREGELVDFMETRSALIIAVLEKLAQEKIAGAYPTETVLLTNVTPPAPVTPKPAARTQPQS